MELNCCCYASRGADAVRALQAQQKAGAGGTPPTSSWGPADLQGPSGNGEPSVGRGPIGRESDKQYPPTVDAEVCGLLEWKDCGFATC